jgi:hypothetical protein
MRNWVARLMGRFLLGGCIGFDGILYTMFVDKHATICDRSDKHRACNGGAVKKFTGRDHDGCATAFGQ